jgi:hypothetical protein
LCEFAKGPAAGDLGSRVRATNVAGASGVQNSTYTPDEYKFEMLSPDVVVMTHRGTTKGMKDGKEVTESHRRPARFPETRRQVASSRQCAVADFAVRQVSRQSSVTSRQSSAIRMV